MEANNPNQHLYEVIVRLPALVLPDEQRKLEMVDRLHIYFQSKDGGDSDVECVHLLGGNDDGFWFKVWFVERSGKLTFIFFNLNLRFQMVMPPLLQNTKY